MASITGHFNLASDFELRGDQVHDNVTYGDAVMIREGRVAFEGSARDLRTSKDPYLQTFLS